MGLASSARAAARGIEDLTRSVNRLASAASAASAARNRARPAPHAALTDAIRRNQAPELIEALRKVLK